MIVTFRPNQIQLKYLALRGVHRYNRILKARQLGFTTLRVIEMLDRALWTPGMSCAIIAHEREAVNKIFEIVKRAYENIPDTLKPLTNTDTKQAYRFTYKYDGTPLDSEIYVALKLRSTTVQELHISEAAYIKDKQEMSAGTKQAVPKSGRITEETTGHGMDSWYDAYMSAKTDFKGGEMDYKTYFFAWHENDEYTLPGVVEKRTEEEVKASEMVFREYGYHLSDEQILWRRWKIRDLAADRDKKELGLSPIQLFKQEYPSVEMEAFQSGAGNVFNPELVDDIAAYNGSEHHEIKGLMLWKIPEEDHRYVIGSDPSDGAVDYGTVSVWDHETLEKVAEFKGKLLPDLLAEKIRDIAVYFNQAFVGVENNQLSTVLFLSKIYDNIYFTTTVDERLGRQTKKLGWSTNTKSRDLMIDEYLIAFEEGSLVIHSPTTKQEMMTFVKKENGKREHADGKHDDMLFADMIALQMRRAYGSTILDMYKQKAAELDNQKK